MIPLSHCEIVVPENNGKSFGDALTRRVFKANDGYEFEIKTKSSVEANEKQFSVRLYALSDGERDEWVSACEDRIREIDESGTPVLGQGASQLLPHERGKIGNVTITTTKLAGPSPVAEDFSVIDPETNSQELFSSSIDRSKPKETKIEMTASLLASNIKTYSPFSVPAQSIKPFSSSNEVSKKADDEETNESKGDDDEAVDEETEDPIDEETLARLTIANEARKRQRAAREATSSRQTIEDAREEESQNPMNLATIYRILLFFIREELVEDPRPDLNFNLPHLKGEWAENLVITIYQYYCGFVVSLSVYNTLTGM